jgi:hypothetical protein
MRKARGASDRQRSRRRLHLRSQASACTLALGQANAKICQLCSTHSKQSFMYLWCSNDTGVLRPPGNQPSSHTIEIWVGSHALPVPPTSCHSAHRPNKRAILSAKCRAILEHQIAVKGGCQMDTSRERRHKLLSSNAIWRICEAEFRDVQPWHRTCLSDTWACNAMREIRLLF